MSLAAVSTAAVSFRQRDKSVSFNKTLLTMAVSGSSATPWLEMNNSPKVPFNFMPCIKSLEFTVAPCRDMPSTSTCFFSNGSNCTFTCRRRTLSNVSLCGEAASTSVTTRFNGKDKEIRPTEIFIPVASEAYTAALSTRKF